MGGEGIENVFDDTELMADVAEIQAEVGGLDGEAMRGTDNAALAIVATEARLSELDAANLPSDIDTLIERQEDMLGNASIGRAVTATLHVSPNGSGADGLSWRTAYTTIQAALDAASTDADSCTLILISPHATNYDINTTGDPTWAANVILKGSHRNWSEIRNTHVGATSILNLTGKIAIIDLAFNLGTGSANGVILTASGFHVEQTVFEGGDLTGAATALWIDGDTALFGDILNCAFDGHVTHMAGLLLDNAAQCEIRDSHIHNCLTGIQIVNAASDFNFFRNLDICDTALGIDIDAGNAQRFRDIQFHHCTVNVDDEVGDHSWVNIYGEFPVTIEPYDLTGVTLTTGAAGVYGADTEIRAAATSTVPFRIVAIHVEPDTVEWYQLRLSDDSGSTFFDVIHLYGSKREGTAAPSGTEYIFNVGTRISGSLRDETGADNAQVWLEIQEI